MVTLQFDYRAEETRISMDMNPLYYQHIPRLFPSFLLAMFLFFTGCSFNVSSQTNRLSERESREARIDSVFSQAEKNNLNTAGTLRYEYFFRDERKEFVEDFAESLVKDSFEIIGLYQKEKEWQLRVMRNEKLSRASVEKQERKFRWLKFKFLIDHYDGFTIWPADLVPEKVPQEEFIGYANALDDQELFWVADRLLYLKSYPKALVAWQKVVDRNVYPDTSNYKYGSTLIATNEYVDGIELWEKAVAINPHYVEVYMDLGKIYYENSHWNKALLNFQKADVLNPNNSQILYHVAETLFQLGRYNESHTYSKRSVKLDRDNDYARSLLRMHNLPSVRKARKANP